jgi:hypothetical protein
MDAKMITRMTFAMGMMAQAMAWWAVAVSPASPGGTDITHDELADLVGKILMPLGITVDPVIFKTAIKEVA